MIQIKVIRRNQMKLAVLLISALLLATCGETPSNPETTSVEPNSSSTKTEAREDARFEVKVMLNGTELASYKQSGPRIVVLNDGESLTMFLSSPDNKNVLTLVIQGTKAGNYPLPFHDGAPKPGEARLELMHDDKPPVRIATDGEVRLETLTKNLCSGSFKGTGTDINGGKFSIEGSFLNMGVQTEAAN
jgi:hypothetical protein